MHVWPQKVGVSTIWQFAGQSVVTSGGRLELHMQCPISGPPGGISTSIACRSRGDPTLSPGTSKAELWGSPRTLSAETERHAVRGQSREILTTLLASQYFGLCSLVFGHAPCSATQPPM